MFVYEPSVIKTGCWRCSTMETSSVTSRPSLFCGYKLQTKVYQYLIYRYSFSDCQHSLAILIERHHACQMQYWSCTAWHRPWFYDYSELGYFKYAKLGNMTQIKWRTCEPTWIFKFFGKYLIRKHMFGRVKDMWKNCCYFNALNTEEHQILVTRAGMKTLVYSSFFHFINQLI